MDDDVDDGDGVGYIDAIGDICRYVDNGVIILIDDVDDADRRY